MEKELMPNLGMNGAEELTEADIEKLRQKTERLRKEGDEMAQYINKLTLTYTALNEDKKKEREVMKEKLEKLNQLVAENERTISEYEKRKSPEF